jgi:hypothetical protein
MTITMKSFSLGVLFSVVLLSSTNYLYASGGAGGDPSHYHMWEDGDMCDGYDWVCAEPWGDDCTVCDRP